MMFCRVNTCSVHERPLLKPACSSHRVRSTASCSLFSSTLLKTLPGVESSVIPHQLLQSLRLPFFGSLIITHSYNESFTILQLYAKTTSSQNVHWTNGSEEERRLVHRWRRDVLQRHWLVARYSTSSKLHGYLDRLSRMTVR